MVLKPLTAAELAVLAAGPPAQRPDDLFGWKKERNRYDGLVRRQKNLAKAAEPPQPSRRSATGEEDALCEQGVAAEGAPDARSRRGGNADYER